LIYEPNRITAAGLNSMLTASACVIAFSWISPPKNLI
jgi:hypothetical protein